MSFVVVGGTDRQEEAHTRIIPYEHVITARRRNEEDGCQIIEGLVREVHFPPVHARTI